MTRQGQCKIERSNQTVQTSHIFWWTPEFVSVGLFKVKKYSKTRKVFEFLKLTAKAEKVMESHRICRAQKSKKPCQCIPHE